MQETDKMVVSKVPIQDTRLFTKNYGNSQNLNKLLMNEITKVREKDPKGLPATNQGCWRSLHKYKCEVELFKPITAILASWTDHYFPNIPFTLTITFLVNLRKSHVNKWILTSGSPLVSRCTEANVILIIFCTSCLWLSTLCTFPLSYF